MNWLKTKRSWILLAAAVVVGSSLAQNALDNPTRDLIERLTETPVDTWLGAGTIKVLNTTYRAPRIIDPEELEKRIQQEIQDYQNNPHKVPQTPELQADFLAAIPFNTRYDYANESTTVTQEVIRFDGDLFHLKSTILSHSDSVHPEPGQASNYYIRYINVEASRNQVHTFDGQRLTHYSESGNLALEEDGQGNPANPRSLNAGIIPWGYGIYTRANLLESRPSASSEVVNGKQRTHLTFMFDTGLHMEIVLDPDTLAMYHRTFTWANGAISSTELSNHVQVNGRWIPTEIYEEQLAPEDNGYRLLTWDTWQLDILNTERPQIEYAPDYKEGATIRYSSPLSKSSQRYYYHSGANTKTLLTKRLNAVAALNSGTANCATLTLQEVAARLGQPITASLDALIDETGFTSLAAMQQFLQKQGFYCKAVQTTIEHLADYNTQYEVILHLPGSEHYVLLDAVEDDEVWTLDLMSNTFYKSTSVDVFSQQWADGTALLVSTEPIQSEDPVLSEAQLRAIVGAAWSCIVQIQEEGHVTNCTAVPPCIGSVWELFDLWICGSSETGTCDTDDYIQYVRIPCIPYIYNPSICDQASTGYFVSVVNACDGEPY